MMLIWYRFHIFPNGNVVINVEMVQEGDQTNNFYISVT